jgi:hypothetical protein
MQPIITYTGPKHLCKDYYVKDLIPGPACLFPHHDFPQNYIQQPEDHNSLLQSHDPAELDVDRFIQDIHDPESKQHTGQYLLEAAINQVAVPKVKL